MTLIISVLGKVLLLAAVALLIGFFYELIQVCKYKKCEKQLEQLKRICQYFIAYKIDPIEAEKYRGKDIIVEYDWLYTDYFFFNLKHDDVFNKLEAYYVELMKFFITHKRMNDKETYKKILEFGDVLSVLA